jgi:hypothetical protein
MNPRTQKRTNGSASAVIRGILLIREASAQRASTSGLKPRASHAANGQRIPIGMRSDRLREALGFATCSTSHPRLDETSEPTKPRRWRSAKPDASPSLP